MSFVERSDPHCVPKAGTVSTVTTNTDGATCPWIPVDRRDVGIDLRVVSGTARVEMTACAAWNLSNAVATTVSQDSLTGTLGAGTSGSTTLYGAAFVRLVATGQAEISVRT